MLAVTAAADVVARLRALRAPVQLLERLATPHGLDRYLELVHPMLAVHEVRAEVAAVRANGPDAVTLTLRPTRTWHGFRAGQFVAMTVDIDGVRRTRCFSPVDSQHRADGRFEITVRRTPDGLVSSWLCRHARPGLVVGLSQADGAFTLPTPRPRRLVFVSGGSGVTPVLSMARTLADEHYDGEAVFLHYADDAEHVLHADDLRELGDLGFCRVVVAHTGDERGELTGLFRAEHLRAVAPWFAQADTYVCGPPGLMRAVREHYRRTGSEHTLHMEKFTPVLSSVPSDTSGTVTFAASGVSAPNSGATLLEQAEAAGLAPEYGCRMGICFSCTQLRSSGCTRNLRTGETDSDPDAEIQLCISVPVGDVELKI